MEQLESVGLTTLIKRRERRDMIETFKTINGFNRVNKASWFKFRNADSNRATRSTVAITGGKERDRNGVLYKQSIQLKTRKNFFSARVVDRWNIVPDEVKAQKTINGFKYKYEEWVSEARRQEKQE